MKEYYQPEICNSNNNNSTETTEIRILNGLFHNGAFLILLQCKVLGYVHICKGLMLVLMTKKFMAVL
jgi:hypothetical protein